jgi:flagellar hook-length control protein FliK
MAGEEGSPLWRPLTQAETVASPRKTASAPAAGAKTALFPAALTPEAGVNAAVPASVPAGSQGEPVPAPAMAEPADFILADDLPAADRPPMKADPAAPQPPAPALAAPSAPAAPMPAATPHTVSDLAAQIAAQVAPAKASRFTVQLNPVGLGKVDVRVAITAAGELSAALSFHEPHAARELSAKASELQTALTQAGFDPSRTQLSFSTDTGGSNPQLGQQLAQQQQQQRDGQTPSFRQASFVDLSGEPDLQLPVPVRTARDGGVDVTV